MQAKNDLVLYGMLASIALVFSFIESLIPINLLIPIPGIKLGLANIVIIWVLYSMGTTQAYIINVARVLLSGFLFGSLYSIIFAMAGALVSLTVMWALKKTKKFSSFGVSIAGGITHNIAQIMVAMIVLENARLVYYLPVLLISGVVSGIAVGILGTLLYSKVKIQMPKEGKK